MIPSSDYAEFLDEEYLRTYVAESGAAVKFVVAADDGQAAEFSNLIQTRARSNGYVVVRVDAVTTRIHMMDQVFFDAARQIDWDTFAAATVRSALAEVGYPIPDDDADVTIASVAARYDVDPHELSRDVNRQLQLRIGHDFAMVQEFRTAMLRLCQAQLATGQVTDAEHSAVTQWLRGELRQISLLKSALIFRRIGRHNARQLLFSLAHWLSVNHHTGLFVELDVRRLGFARRPRPDERMGNYYTKAALLDAYELLRQLVDNTDELSHCCVVVQAAPEFLTDNNRGLDAYQALKLRIYDDVRDRRRDNPYSSLVRLGTP